MSQPKRHHWIPQFYLKWFATPGSVSAVTPQVYIYHRATGEPELVSIRNVAVKKYLYAPFQDNETRVRDYSREKDLAELEGIVSQIWPALASDFIDLRSEPFRKGLSLFLATLFLRHPYSLVRQRESRRQLLRIIDAAPKNSDGTPSIRWLEFGREKQRIPFDVEQWRTLLDATEDDEHRLFVDMIRSEASNVAEGLMRKRWSMVFMDEPRIVTSDNPFFVMDPDMKRDQVLGPGAKLMFPVSPTRVLCFDELDEPGGRYYKLSGEQAPLYNMFTWVNTDDFMISPRHPDEVLIELDALRRQAEIEESREHTQ